MVLVEGEYVPSVGHLCEEYVNEKQDRCKRYRREPLRAGKARRMRFCMDRYEYPNLAGVKPVVMADWHDAREACEIEGKRLCFSKEWTLACEGAEQRPYPYGWERDRGACNIDRPRPDPEPDFEAFRRPRAILGEVARLDLRVASGERGGCVSEFGVHDLTGNVDEWVINEQHFEPLAPGKEEEDRPYVSGLKGGYWGPIRARCRPMTTAHNEWFRFYQVGFRCCADPLRGGALRDRLPRLPRRGAPGLLP
jgi:sulfatase modifying factor 1